MSRLSLVPRRHDPYWDMDGTGAQRVRDKRRVVRMMAWLVLIVVLAVIATRLPTVDPEFLVHGGGRPILAGALLTLLGSAALLALVRVRHVSRR